MLTNHPDQQLAIVSALFLFVAIVGIFRAVGMKGVRLY
jgi:hypothetical protein